MVRLAPDRYETALKLYRVRQPFFPLIGAVLEGVQDGVVYCADEASPQQFYVEHHFGFAEVFGERSPPFQSSLQRYLLTERRFKPAKIRLYAPGALLSDPATAFLEEPQWLPMRAWRQRFIPGLPALSTAFPAHARSVLLDEALAVAQLFGVEGRFWRGAAEYATLAPASVMWIADEPAALCYAAAVSQGRAEIDVVTRPDFRQRGAARQAVSHFVESCLRQSLTPVWDCFANNAGSMALARATGFTPQGAVYPFFTISK